MTRILMLALAGVLAGVGFGMEDENERKRKFAGDDVGELGKKLAKVEIAEESAFELDTLDSADEEKTEGKRTESDDEMVVFKTATGSEMTLMRSMLEQPGYGFFYSLYLANPDPRKPVFLPMTGWALEFFADFFFTDGVHFDGMEKHRIKFLRDYANKFMVQKVFKAASIELMIFLAKWKRRVLRPSSTGLKSLF